MIPLKPQYLLFAFSLLTAVILFVQYRQARTPRGHGGTRPLVLVLGIFSVAAVFYVTVRMQEDLATENTVLRVLAREHLPPAPDKRPVPETPALPGRGTPVAAVTAVSEEMLSAPSMTQEDAQRLRSDLSSLKNNKIIIWGMTNDGGSMGRAARLAEVFSGAGWRVESNCAVTNVPLSGVLLRAQGQTPPGHAARVKEALQRVNMKVAYMPDDDLGAADLVLIVGTP